MKRYDFLLISFLSIIHLSITIFRPVYNKLELIAF